MWRKLQQRHGVEGRGGSTPPGDCSAPVPGMRISYVPPHGGKRGGRGWLSSRKNGAMPQYDDRQSSLRVTNIRRRRPRQICRWSAPYGRIARIYLAKDRETISQGFAFVVCSRQDAERRWALQGHGYDHLILKIEWAKPRRRSPRGWWREGWPVVRHRGYGKACANQKRTWAV